MTSRCKRPSKAVNYAALDGSTSDDDFADFTPPTKKKNESKKKKKEKNKENDTKKIDEVESSTQLPHKKSPTHRERLSLEERKFQRDLELALELSAGNKDATKESFQGFNDENKTSDGSDMEFFSPVRNMVTTADVHSTLSGHKIAAPKEEGLKSALHDSKNDSPVVLIGASGRQRKKVNFVEDDSSDSSSDMDALKKLSSESEESDFFPSPKAKKSKTKPKAEKKTVNSKNKETKGRKPLKLKQTDLVIPLPDKDTPPSGIERLKPQHSPEATTSKKVVSTPISRTLPNCGRTVPALVKNPFKSPSLGSSPSSTCRQPLANTARIGLRLGLSRKVHSKPLHPNASVK